MVGHGRGTTVRFERWHSHEHSEQIRATPDQVADWVLLACGYDAATLESLARTELSPEALMSMDAAQDYFSAIYALSYSATPADVADVA